LSYVYVLQLFVGTFASSSRHERTPIVRKICMKMQMQDSFDDFYFNQPQTIDDNQGGVLVGNIHLDKKYIQQI
jgi:hypothetical protein